MLWSGNMLSKLTEISRTCNLCNVMMTGGINGFTEHGNIFHPDHYLTGTIKNGNFTFVDKKYWCPLDNKWYSSLKHLSKTVHSFGYTNEEYYKKYAKEYMPIEWNTNNNDEKYGDYASKPECLQCNKKCKFTAEKWYYPKFCSFSCSTKWHAYNTNRIEQSLVTRNEKKANDPDFMLGPNQIRYWTNKGHSEEEAKKLVSTRQKSCHLEAMIEKYGEEDGTKRYNKGLKRRKEAIMKSDMFKGGSKVATELFNKVAESISGLLYGDCETCIWLPLANKNIWVDCLDPESKKVIEFYGDFWHANPSRFLAEDKMFKSSKKTAAEQWKRDEIRTKHIKDGGYDLLVIWEKEYRANPDLALGKCIGFLTAK